MDQTSRRVIIAANWKMYKTADDVNNYAGGLLHLLQPTQAEVIIIPAAILVPAVVDAFAKTTVKVGVQNIYWQPEGAFTGEISLPMAKVAGADYCLCGHSERRHYFGESAEMVTRKAAAAIDEGLIPIVCIGETLDERENGEAFDVLHSDLFASLSAIEPNSDLIIAYEPVWAIGTGRVASSADAEEAICYIRKQLFELWGDIANQVSIIYGGSVNPNNIKDLLACSNIDGVLVGGASLKPDSFAAIVNAVS